MSDETTNHNWLLQAGNGQLDLRTGELKARPEPPTTGSPGSPGVPPVPPHSSRLAAYPPISPAARVKKDGGTRGTWGDPGDPPSEPLPTSLPDPDLQLRFLEALSSSGSVPEAARVVGIAPRTPRRWARDDDAFAKVMTKAKEVGMLVRLDVMEQEADRRAMEGVEKPVYQGGRLVGTRREYSDLLLIFRLKRADPAYRDSYPLVHVGQQVNIRVNFANGTASEFGADGAIRELDEQGRVVRTMSPDEYRARYKQSIALPAPPPSGGPDA